MSLSLSTGLRGALATTFGLQVMMAGGLIVVYDGSRPATPDDAPDAANELGYITQDGVTWAPNGAGGLQLQSLLPGTVQKAGVWRIKGLRNGTGAWFRWYWGQYDSRGQSSYFPRIDGDVGPDLVLRTTQITPETDEPIDSVYVVLPFA